MKYWSFVSYSHADSRAAARIGRWLESFRLPARLSSEPLPKKLAPIFRDRDELSGSSDLGGVIREALAQSRTLIVVCSPAAVRSTWVNEEIHTFRALHGPGAIFPVLVEGDLATALPEALLRDRDGVTLPEPLAIDMRPSTADRSSAKLRLIAAILGIEFDMLRQRAKARANRQRVLAACLAALVAGAVAALVLHVRNDDIFAEQSRLLVRDSRAALARHDAVSGMLYALEALPKNLAHPDRPYVADAEYALENAVAQQQEQMDLTGSEPFSAVTVSPDGRRIATGDTIIRLWDATTGAPLAVLGGDMTQVYSAQFSPDGRRLLSAANDGTVRVWNAASGAPIATLLRGGDVPLDAAFSPDGRRVVASSGRHLYLWDGGHPVRLAANPVRENILSVAFSPDGTRFVSAGDGGTLQIWDAASGNRIAAFHPPEGANLSFDLDTRAAYSVGFSPDGRFAISSGADGVIRIWNPANGVQIGTINGHAGAVRSAMFAVDGRHVVSGGDDRTVRTWLTLVPGGPSSFLSYPIAVLGGHTDRINAVAALPDGDRIASASDDKTVRIWGPLPGIVFRTADGLEVRDAAVSPDGRRVATATSGPRGSAPVGVVSIWDAATGAQLARHRESGTGFDTVTFSPDGTRIVSAASDGTVREWNARLQQIAMLRGHTQAVDAAAFSPDGRTIVSASADQTVREWEAASGKPLHVIAGFGAEVTSVAYSPNGTHIVSASYDKTVRVLDAASGAPIVTIPVKADVNSVAYSPDGKRIVGASSDGNAYVWDAASGSQIAVLNADPHDLNDAVYSPDGSRIVTAGGDGTRVWDAASGAPIATFSGGLSYDNAAVYSADSNAVLSGSGDGTARLVPMPRGQTLIDEARVRLPRQLSPEQRATMLGQDAPQN